MNQYPTNLTDKQWQVTENILDPQHRLLLLQQVEAGRRIQGTYGHAPSDGPQTDGAQGTHCG